MLLPRKLLLWQCSHSNECMVQKCEHKDPHLYVEGSCHSSQCLNMNTVVRCCRVKDNIATIKTDEYGQYVDIWSN